MTARTIDVAALIEREPVRRLQILVMLQCTVVVILDGFDVQSIAFTGPAIARELSIPPARMGALFGAGMIGMVVGTLTIGPLGDRFGRKPAIVGSVASFGAFSLATAVAQSFEHLLVLRFLTGLGLGGAIPNLTALVAEYAPSRWRPMMISVIFLGIPLGGLLGAGLTAELLPFYGWRVVFVIGGVLPLAVSLMLLASLPESTRYLATRGDRGREIARILGRMFPRQTFRDTDIFVTPDPPRGGFPIRRLFEDGRACDTAVLWGGFFLNLVVVYYLISWIPSLIVHAGFPVEKGALASLALNLGGLCGCLALPALVGPLGARRVLRAGFVAASIGVAAIGQATTLSSILVLTFVGGFLTFGTQVVINGMAAALYPTEIRATGVGWAFGIGRIGSVLGPVAGGFLLALGYSTPVYFFLFGALLALAATIAGLMRHGS